MAKFRYNITAKDKVMQLIGAADKTLLQIEIDLGSFRSYWLRKTDTQSILARMSKATFNSLLLTGKLTEVDNPFINLRTFNFK